MKIDMYDKSLDSTDMLSSHRRQRPAFISRAPRFGTFTGHPELNKTSVYSKKPTGCDPCLYNPNIYNKKCGTPHPGCEPWLYQKELEEWAKSLGYRNQNLLKMKADQATKLGPAWYEIKEYPKVECAIKNLDFGRAKRFRPAYKDMGTPGPGTYYKTVPFKAPYGPHSSRPTFEREDPCRFRDSTPKWYRGVSYYNIIDKDSIAMKPKKLVSRRGPYDLFSVKREAQTIISKLTHVKECYADTWPYPKKDSFETLKKSHFGVMNKTGKDKAYFGRNALFDISLRVRKPEEPGPGHYNVYPVKEIKQNTVPFNSSVMKKVEESCAPGVGMYKVRGKRKSTSGYQGAFKSKKERDINEFLLKNDVMNAF